MAERISRLRRQVSNVAFGVLGNALWSAISGGAVLSVIVTAGAHFSQNPVWVNRGWGAVGACALIAILTGLISVARSHFISKELNAPLNASRTRGFAALAVRHLYQSPSSGDSISVWLLVSIKANDRPVSIVRWQASVKWTTSQPVVTLTFLHTHELDDDDSLWWQGTHYARNLAWGNLALEPNQQVDGYLHFAFDHASERRLDGRIEQVSIECIDISGEISATKETFQPLPTEDKSNV